MLALGLGQSAVYSIVAIDRRLHPRERSATRRRPSTPRSSDRAIFDLIYQLLGISSRSRPSCSSASCSGCRAAPTGAPGLRRQPARPDALWGVSLALVDRHPRARASTSVAARSARRGVEPSALDCVLVDDSGARSCGPPRRDSRRRSSCSATCSPGSGTSAGTAGRSSPRAALFRGSYHLYQGFGAFVGNVMMGLMFGWLYSRTRRVLPFVIAHALLDAAIFIGYPWAAATWPELFGVAQLGCLQFLNPGGCCE